MRAKKLDSSTDIEQLAKQIQAKCKLIPSSKLELLTTTLCRLQEEVAALEAGGGAAAAAEEEARQEEARARLMQADGISEDEPSDEDSGSPLRGAVAAQHGALDPDGWGDEETEESNQRHDRLREREREEDRESERRAAEQAHEDEVLELETSAETKAQMRKDRDRRDRERERQKEFERSLATERAQRQETEREIRREREADEREEHRLIREYGSVSMDNMDDYIEMLYEDEDGGESKMRGSHAILMLARDPDHLTQLWCSTSR